MIPTAVQRRVLIDLLADAEAALIAGSASLLKVLREGIPLLIPSELTLTTQFDRAAGRTTTVATDRGFVDFRTQHLAHWKNCLATHPTVAYFDNGGSERAIRFSDVVSQRAYRELALYNDFFRPFDVRHKLDARLWLPLNSTIDVGFSRAGSDFTDRERELLDTLQPHLQSLATRAMDGSAVRQLRIGFDLTLREAEVLSQLARGRTNPQIAAALFLSPGTVRKHLERIYGKLGVRNRTSAARLALGSIGDGPRLSSTLTSLGLTTREDSRALTPRESDVMHLVRLGKSNAEAGLTLGVSTSTIRRHLEHIYAKTGAHTRAEASVYPFFAAREPPVTLS